MDRRNFLMNSALSAASVRLFSENGFASFHNSNSPVEIPEEASIPQLQELMTSGKISSKMLITFFLDRIKAIDKAGPKLNAFIELNPEAVQIAENMDAERAAGRVRGPLHGIPVAVKDNINTADKMMTTAGSLALLNHFAKKDAFIINCLRDAGAVIIGKTNLTEWSNFRSTRSVSGWSSRGGQTKNACVLDRNPSGSSSGSAVAVAANLCTVAIGTETNGSIISPAANNGVVGIKPTVGLVSRSGIIPISFTQDTAGPIARTVTDAAILLGVIAGADWDDSGTISPFPKPGPDFTTEIRPDALKGKRIGIEASHLHGHEGVVALFKEAIETMKMAGATIVEIEYLKATSASGYDQYETLLYEFHYGLNEYLQKFNAPLKSLEELIEFNDQNAASTMPYFKQEIFEQALRKGDLDKQHYKDNRRKRDDVRDAFFNIFHSNKLNAICGVSTGLPGAIDYANGDYYTGFNFCSPSAAIGYPHITVPMGKVHSLPVGISFVHRAYDEPELIALAYAYEQASKKREPPSFIPSLLS